MGTGPNMALPERTKQISHVLGMDIVQNRRLVSESPTRRTGAPPRLRQVRVMRALLLFGLLFAGCLTCIGFPATAGAGELSQSQAPCSYLSKSIARSSW